MAFASPKSRMAFFEKLRDGKQEPTPVKQTNPMLPESPVGLAKTPTLTKTPVAKVPKIPVAAATPSVGEAPQNKFGRLTKKLRY